MSKKIKVKKAKKSAIRFLLFGVTCFTLSCFIVLSISNIWSQIYEKYIEKKELENRLANLQEEEANLTIDVEKMKDPEYIARYLREKYLYSKDGEIIIRIPKN